MCGEAGAAGPEAEAAKEQQPQGQIAVAGPLDEITGSMAIPFADVGNPIMAQVGPVDVTLANVLSDAFTAAGANQQDPCSKLLIADSWACQYPRIGKFMIDQIGLFGSIISTSPHGHLLYLDAVPADKPCDLVSVRPESTSRCPGLPHAALQQLLMYMIEHPSMKQA